MQADITSLHCNYSKLNIILSTLSLCLQRCTVRSRFVESCYVYSFFEQRFRKSNITLRTPISPLQTPIFPINSDLYQFIRLYVFPAWISTPTSQAVAKKRTFQIPRSITHTHNTRYARKIKEKNKTRKGKQEKGKQEKTRTSKTPVEKKP